MGKRFQRCLIATQACVKSNHRQCVQYMYGSFVGFSGSRRQLDPVRWAEYRFEQGAEERAVSRYKHVHERQFNSGSLDSPRFPIQLHIKH